MKQDCDHHSDNRQQKAVSKGIPKIRYPHCLRKVTETPGLWQRQRAHNIIGHLRRLFKGDHNRHIQREKYSQTAKDQ